MRVGLRGSLTSPLCGTRAYEAVKAQQVAEAAQRAEEARLINLLYAEEAEARERRQNDERAQAQAEQRALMLAANQEQRRLKVQRAVLTSLLSACTD